jgi:hypothetical protein
MFEPLKMRCRTAGSGMAGLARHLACCVARSLADAIPADQARRPVAVMACLMLAVITAAVAATGADEAYPLPGRGKLRAFVPEDWQVRYVYTEDHTISPTLHVFPLEGKSFEMTVTVYWHDGLDEDIYSAESLLRRVQQAAEATRVDAGLGDRPPDIQRFEGLRRPGFLYDLHDQSAGDGEFENLTQGAFVSGRLVLAFTLLTQTRSSPERERCLDFLRTIRHDYAFQGVALPRPVPALGPAT